MNKNYLAMLGLCAAMSGCAMFGGSTGSSQQNTGAAMSDSSIQSNLSAKLGNSDNFPNSNIYVDVVSGQVLLTGQVQDQNQKSFMLNVVRGYPGVIKIYDYTQIRLPSSFSSRSSDSMITTAVKTKLLGASGIPSNSIKVETTDGVVYLMGVVTQSQGESAAQLTAMVGSVQQVVTLFQNVGQ
jgi:osmotically-inducible protein OsmY